MVKLIGLLYGPIPTTVEAAISKLYVAYSSKLPTDWYGLDVLNTMLGIVNDRSVIMTVYFTIGPFRMLSSGGSQLVLAVVEPVTVAFRNCGTPNGSKNTLFSKEYHNLTSIRKLTILQCPNVYTTVGPTSDSC